MPKIEYPVLLSDEERLFLLEIIEDFQIAEQKINRAHILLKADEGKHDNDIADFLGVNIVTVIHTRKRFAKGLPEALNERPRTSQRRKVNEKTEQKLISLLKQPPPNEKPRWTLHLLASHMRKLDKETAISHEAIRYTLRRLGISLRRPIIQ